MFTKNYSLSQNGWDTLGSPCPLNVGGQDLVTKLQKKKNNFERDGGEHEKEKNSIWLKCSNYFCLRL